MTRDEWQRIKTIAGDALDRSDEARAAFVLASCGDDIRLRREVESLLTSTADASHLFESPALSMDGGTACQSPAADRRREAVDVTARSREARQS